MATLTGGVLIALGTRVAGIMGNSERDIDDLRVAAIARESRCGRCRSTIVSCR
jgi:leucyl aminopeptidase